MSKTTERVGLLIAAYGIILCLVPPKTPITIIIALALFVGLVCYALWDLLIEQSLERKIIAMVVLCFVVVWLGYNAWPNQDSFKIETDGMLIGHGFFMAPDNELVPLSLGICIKVTNTGPSVVGIEGFRLNIIFPNLLDSGVIVERSYPLRSVENLDKNVYILPKGITKSTRLDFSGHDFRRIAGEAQLSPTRWITGWIFAETSKEIADLVNKPVAIEFIIISNTGKIQRKRRELSVRGDTPGQIGSEFEIVPTERQFKVMEDVDLSNYKVKKLRNGGS
jgi:hypothetical protein